MTTAAGERWRRELAGWAIPDELLAAAPASPWGCDPDQFAARATQALEHPGAAARTVAEVTPAGGVVLDVGCGGGAASLPAAPPAGALIGVDQSGEMLTRYAEGAAGRGVPAETVQGTWPEAAPDTPAADVVVVQDVLHNIPAIEETLTALTGHARRRVVVALPDRHPLTWLTPYWRVLHDLDRPRGPTADDAFAVADTLGFEPAIRRVSEPGDVLLRDPDALVPTLRRRLCCRPEDDDRIAALTRRFPPPETRYVAVLTWAGRA